MPTDCSAVPCYYVREGAPAGFDFHLDAALPGASLPSPYDVDMDGVTRGADGVFDRGAFEYAR